MKRIRLQSPALTGPLSFAVMAALPTHAQDQMTARDPKRAG